MVQQLLTVYPNVLLLRVRPACRPTTLPRGSSARSSGAKISVAGAASRRIARKCSAEGCVLLAALTEVSAKAPGRMNAQARPVRTRKAPTRTGLGQIMHLQSQDRRATRGPSQRRREHCRAGSGPEGGGRAGRRQVRMPISDDLSPRNFVTKIVRSPPPIPVTDTAARPCSPVGPASARARFVTRLHAHTHTTQAHTNTRAHTHAHSQTHTNTHQHTPTHTNTSKHARTHLHAHKRARAHTRAHTHTHTHAHSGHPMLILPGLRGALGALSLPERARAGALGGAGTTRWWTCPTA